MTDGRSDSKMYLKACLAVWTKHYGEATVKKVLAEIGKEKSERSF